MGHLLSPRTFIRLALPLTLLGLAVHAGHSAFDLGGELVHDAVEAWMTTALTTLAALICLAGAFSRPDGRLPFVLLAAAIASWTTGEVVFQLLYTEGVTPIPSLGDMFYTGFYPLATVALILVIRARLRDTRLWLDGLVVALTLWAVLIAVGSDPILNGVDARSPAVIASLVYPVADLGLLGLMVAAITMAGLRVDGRVWLIAAGMVSITVADWGFSYHVANGTYVNGRWFDSAWPLGMLLIGCSAWVPAGGRTRSGNLRGPFALAAGSALAALVVLVVDHYHRVPEAALWLAAAAFVVRTLRTMVAFADQSRALRNSQVTAALVRSSDIAIFRVSPAGVVLTWNPGAALAFGREPSWAVGRPLTDLVAADSVEIVQRLIDTATSDAAGSVDIHAERGATEVSIHLSPVRDESGIVVSLTAVARDVTQRRQAEEADRANKAKSEFLSRMSHELRTPLNSVLGFGQLLAMRDLDDEARDEVQRILTAGDHLLELINETLEISHIESGRLALTIEPVAPAEAVDEVVGLMAPLSAAREITVDVDAGSLGEWMAADRQRLKQVLLNLLSNAIKFNQYGGRVCVRGARLDNGRVAIAVSDTGHGIAPEDMPRLFAPFERLRKDDAAIEGSGLGLALSAGLMEAMGGTIDAVSAPGVGSTFTLELPHAEAVAGARRERPLDTLLPGPHTDGAGEQRTVLYIEDNGGNRELMEQVFAALDDTGLITAVDGGRGLAAAFAELPDLVLLDLNLPDMHGHEVLDRLRGDERTRATPVIVVSADATQPQIDAALARGAFDYVTKPIDIRRLLELLDAALVPTPVQQ